MASHAASQDAVTAVPSQPNKGSQCTLPPERVFSIQIGTELFRLSGASIASDAPSYFSQFFEEQLRQNGDGSNLKTLYIDRDPKTFQDIAKHLQGYHVKPQDGSHFVKLFADSQFYHLPRLMSQLFESEIFVLIGERHFQIPRDIFSGPGNSPNFFTLGFAMFFASPSEVFPGLDRSSLLRPPAIVPPTVPNRSGEVFAELLHLLRGYPVDIRNNEHRAELLRDCRYFHLRGLEQMLIPHQISFNPLHQRSEILIRLDDVRQSGLQLTRDNPSDNIPGRIVYARPFVDDSPNDLIIEVAEDSAVLHRDSMRVEFLNLAKARISALFQVILNKINASKTLSETFQILFDDETDVTLNGNYHELSDTAHDSTGPPAKRKRVDSESTKWIVRNGQWRLRIEPSPTGEPELILIPVKLDVYTDGRARNRSRAFLH